MDQAILNNLAVSEIHALISACASKMHDDQLAMLLDNWCAEVDDMRIYKAIKPFVGHSMPSERRDDMRWEAKQSVDEVRQPRGAEHEWSDQEGARYERYLIACDTAEAEADGEWRSEMVKMLAAAQWVLL